MAPRAGAEQRSTAVARLRAPWLAGHQITDLVCDRAHRLSGGQLADSGGITRASSPPRSPPSR